MKPGDDRIEVLGLRVVARHGVLPEERERAQPFEIDLEIEADLSEAARHDDLSKTVDYGSVVEKVTEARDHEEFRAARGAGRRDRRVRADRLESRSSHSPGAQAPAAGRGRSRLGRSDDPPQPGLSRPLSRMLAFLGLGSNLGDRESHLVGAVEGLRKLDPDLKVSPVYETAPVGGPAGQGAYLNCVVRLDTDLTPRELLGVAQALEHEARRVRTVKDGPRTLDIDLLLLDDMVIEEDDLVVPHPRLLERGFVLAPLEDLDPSRVPPDWRRSVPRAGSLDEGLRKVGTLRSS